VPGFYSHDPKLHADAELLRTLSYNQAIDIVSSGGKILHKRAILMAMRNQTALKILPFDSSLDKEGSLIYNAAKSSEKRAKQYENE